jgi:hypothetical protein
MAGMDDPSATPEPTTAPAPSPIPGERRLERPPSERYRSDATTGEPETATDDGAAPARGIVFAVVAAIVLAVALTICGGVLLISAGLVVVAAAGGWAVAMGLRLGAGATIGRGRRRWLAIGLAIAGVLLGQIGLWLFARTEGGVLPILDYLGQTFGPLVPLQLVAAGLGAAWAAR